MKIEGNVDLAGVQPEIVLALVVADGYWRQRFERPMRITSCKDGTHSLQSLHYSGNAVDLGLKGIPADFSKKFFDVLKANLGPQFDVVYETTHIHIEFQPKR